MRNQRGEMAHAPELIPDEELARRAQAGCLDSFEALVSRHEASIYRFVFYCCRNQADAVEIVQETFVRAFNAIGQFDPGRKFAPWLFTIARRKTLDHFRAAPPHADTAGEVPEGVDADDPAELLARAEDREQLWRTARESLSVDQFQALWLRYAEEMDVVDVAGALGKTVTHAKVLLFRARQRLLHELQSLNPKASPASPVPATRISVMKEKLV